MSEILAISLIVFLSLIVFIMILYYVNRKTFNSILRDVAAKIDPDGETPHIDVLPTLPRKEKPAFKEIPKTTPFKTKLLQTPLPPRSAIIASQRNPRMTQQAPKTGGRFAAATGNRISSIFD